MELTPEVAPLLDRKRYAIRLAFVFPQVLDRGRTPAGGPHVDVDIDVFLSGDAAPVRITVPFPDARANVHHLVELNPLLRAAGIAPEREGFIRIHARCAAPGIPPVLKIVGFWVSYRNADVYAVLPSNVQYNSSRVDYGSAADAHLLDYFGTIRLTPEADARISILNPFPVRSDVRIEALAGGVVLGSLALAAEPLALAWVDVAALLPPDRRDAFDGTVRMVSSHRVLWFAWARDRVRDLFYSVDHAIPWINRQV